MTKTILQKIYRFPIKSFPGHELNQAQLSEGIGLPHDRRFALTKYTEDTGNWMQSRNFFINAFDDGLTNFKVYFENDDTTLIVENTDGETITIDLDASNNLEEANTQITDFASVLDIRHDRPNPFLLERKPEIGNWDFPDTPISLINAESVKQLSSIFDIDLDPVRFRGNLILENLPAWNELSFMGKQIKVGEAILEVNRPIMRCPAPGVNPITGTRDIEFQKVMAPTVGHAYCGMYAKVVHPGKITCGDEITIIGDAEIPLETVLEHGGNYAQWPRQVEISDYQITNDKTLITLRNNNPWPLPETRVGQRIRIHLGELGWTQEYISDVLENGYLLEVKDSKTDDPLTAHLLKKLSKDQKLTISGPFGRV